MATSGSDDFESADEEMSARKAAKKFPTPRARVVVDSDSDDGHECFPVQTPQKKFATSSSGYSLHDELQEVNNQEKHKRKERRQRKSKEPSSGAKKLGTKVVEKKTKAEEDDVPDELKSNLKFKDVFKAEGWEGLDEEKVISEHVSEMVADKVEAKVESVEEKEEKSSPTTNAEVDNSWGSWGSWGMTSLINTASAGVSTLTNHVSQGLTLLEESMGVQDPGEGNEVEETKGDETPVDDSIKPGLKESQSQSSFVFSNLMSGVTSLTKLVETTGSKVITGGLDTLEVIGKKTMEVLQDGDPGLKKKRAFFLNDEEKPNLSHILREAKDKADTEEKSVEDKELARKVHFESLFDDYQGLVHLEALEMLSKQANMKIENKLINLDNDELTSMQETLQEIRDLCDLEDENDDDEKQSSKELKDRLHDACKDLGITVNYDKLHDVHEEIEAYLARENSESGQASHQELFEHAISALAQFTAFSVERFHKTAELLLIKERRSTVNETDALVQLARILCSQIGILANSFCDRLNSFTNDEIKADVNTKITTIFLEAANASSYIQDAFKLLIPILQVGAM